MRRLQKKARKPARIKSREPLAEGIVPLTKDGRRSWTSMSDEEIVAYVKKFMKEKRITGKMELRSADKRLYSAMFRRGLLDRVGFEEKKRPMGFFSKMSDDELVNRAKRLMRKSRISGRRGLQKADGGLYGALQRRKLLERVGFEGKRRDWSSLSDEQLVEHARQVMEEEGILSKGKLYKVDGGLYAVLRIRKLLDRVGFEEKQRYWSSFSDEQLVEHTRKFMEEEGISGRSELSEADKGLYDVLYKRKLLDRVGFEVKQGDWSSMSNDGIVVFAKRYMKEKGISGRSELAKVASGLYKALQRRKLMDRVGFEEKRKAGRAWKSMSRYEIVVFARKFMKERGISGRKELEIAYQGLYQTLKKRKLLDSIGFEDKQRSWKTITDREAVVLAQKLMKEMGISGRKELAKIDRGLYVVLVRRKLMDRVGFEQKLRSWKEMSDSEIVDFARELMKKKGICRIVDLAKADQGLYYILKLRKLLKRLKFEKGQVWGRMNDSELIGYARKFVWDNEINKRKGLERANLSLYQALVRRKLMDFVFLDIEKAREREEAQALFDGLMEFGGAE